eukprot:6471543-Amphidinium_carterae.2
MRKLLRFNCETKRDPVFVCVKKRSDLSELPPRASSVIWHALALLLERAWVCTLRSQVDKGNQVSAAERTDN